MIQEESQINTLKYFLKEEIYAVNSLAEINATQLLWRAKASFANEGPVWEE